MYFNFSDTELKAIMFDMIDELGCEDATDCVAYQYAYKRLTDKLAEIEEAKRNVFRRNEQESFNQA